MSPDTRVLDVLIPYIAPNNPCLCVVLSCTLDGDVRSQCVRKDHVEASHHTNSGRPTLPAQSKKRDMGRECSAHFCSVLVSQCRDPSSSGRVSTPFLSLNLVRVYDERVVFFFFFFAVARTIARPIIFRTSVLLSTLSFAATNPQLTLGLGITDGHSHTEYRFRKKQSFGGI